YKSSGTISTPSNGKTGGQPKAGDRGVRLAVTHHLRTFMPTFCEVYPGCLPTRERLERSPGAGGGVGRPARGRMENRFRAETYKPWKRFVDSGEKSSPFNGDFARL